MRRWPPSGPHSGREFALLHLRLILAAACQIWSSSTPRPAALCLGQRLRGTPPGHHPPKALAHPVPCRYFTLRGGDAADFGRAPALLQQPAASPGPPAAGPESVGPLVGDCRDGRGPTSRPPPGRQTCQHRFGSGHIRSLEWRYRMHRRAGGSSEIKGAML